MEPRDQIGGVYRTIDGTRDGALHFFGMSRSAEAPAQVLQDWARADVARPDRWGNLWFEQELDGQWRVAYRLAVQRGRLVVSEVRIFPAARTPVPRAAAGSAQATYRSPAAEAGHWPGSRQGFHARCPAGGVTTRVVRALRIGRDLASVNRYHRQLAKELPQVFAAGHTFAFIGVEKPIARGTQPRRGRPPEADLKYARAAHTYVEACAAGTHPVEAVAHRFRIALTTARVWIQVARRRGLLTPTARGVAGGSLTARAEAVLQKPISRVTAVRA
jgi:hypothetical protein